ncbi:hypothetical protein CU098_008162 [Rhizopus stolonifer]|uniref:Uncharacterized protein n=1 Tax=Rhizopus stolonifer TaxID=4846 RepID=A0A367J673_RHIST|nr:hypothetical protein CU098_008162 [Rhizopus stolonifer]
MTSFSLFIHQNPQVDDRTDMSKVGYQEKNFLRPLDSLIWLVAVFSALPLARPDTINTRFKTTSSSAVFVANNQKEYTYNSRSLNQYYKLHGKNNWDFHHKNMLTKASHQ